MLVRPRHTARYVLATVFVVLLVASTAVVARPHRGEAGTIAFQRGTLSASISQPTSLAFGPDGRLYVLGEGEIAALTLDAAGTHVVGTPEVIDTGLINAMGIAFDPTAPAAPVTFYISHMDSGGTDGFNDVISKYTGPNWTHTDVITGLPTSAPHLNHYTNGIAFDSAGKLYIAQGSGTNAGLYIVNNTTAYWPETPLSSAILVADIHAAGFDGAMTYAPAGQPATDNVDIVSGDVQVFAAGLRNPFDLVLHSSGRIYATDNGPISSDTSLTCATEGGSVNQSDELNLIEQGNYYGFPNRNRGRADPRQCTYHSPLEASTATFTAPVRMLPAHCSCDGIAEYTNDAFGGDMQGDLIFAQYVPGRIERVTLNPDGTVATATILASGFDGPLDVAVGPTGIIYVAEHAGGDIAFLAPTAAPPTPTPGTPTATQTATETSTASVTSTATPPSPTVSATPTPVTPGDADCNHTVNPIDAALELQLSAGLIKQLPCPGNGDANDDGLANAVDAALILQYSAGLIPSLPPP